MHGRTAVLAAVALIVLSGFGGVAERVARADHAALGAVDPVDKEQLAIYEINRARSDPARYGNEIGFDLTGVDPQPPLAMNRNLTGAARFYAEERLDHHGWDWAHVSGISGIGANQRAVDNGYDLFGNGLGQNYGTANGIESVASGYNQTLTFPVAIRALIIDKDVPGFGHRQHLLAMAAQYQAHNEIGCGIAEGTDSFPEYGFPQAKRTNYYTIQTGYRSAANTFITGVVFTDRNRNGRYDAGEGLGGVEVGVVDVGGNPEGGATTNAAGGYTVQVPADSYLVTCSGAAFAGQSRALVTVQGDNVEVDFHSGIGLGEVDFAFQSAGIPEPPAVALAAAPATGMAPLTVDFSVTAPAAEVFSLDFGDGGETGSLPTSHEYDTPGLYPAIVEALGETGVGKALALVSVGGPGGAGEGTTDPASTVLTGTKGLFKAVFTRPGKDQVVLGGTMEMPAAFVPEGTEVQVSAGGVTLPFTLDTKGKGTDANGNRIQFKFKGPKGGGPLGAGVIGKFTVSLKGDLRDRLGAVGLRNRTEVRTQPAVPFAILLGELVYRGEADFAIKGKEGKGSTGKLVPVK